MSITENDILPLLTRLEGAKLNIQLARHNVFKDQIKPETVSEYIRTAQRELELAYNIVEKQNTPAYEKIAQRTIAPALSMPPF